MIAIARGLVPELEGRLVKALGASRWRALRDDLRTVREVFAEER